MKAKSNTKVLSDDHLIMELAEEFYKANKEANEAAKRANNARKNLYLLMKNTKQTVFEFDTADNIPLKVSVETRYRKVLSYAKCLLKVPKIYHNVVFSATKKALEAIPNGKAIATLCEVEEPYTENVYVELIDIESS